MIDPPTEELEFDQTDYAFAMGQGNFRRQTKEERIYGIWAENEEDDDDRPSFGTGKKRPKDSAPLRFVSGGIKLGSKTQLPDGTYDEEEEEQEIIVEARPEKRAKSLFSQQYEQKEMGNKSFAGMRGFASTGAPGTSSDSAWLRSGKGNVVMQMMQKMGYEQGKGLGKSKQGIVEPVQAVQRPGRGAVGAYGSEAKGPKFGESAAEAQERIRTTGEDGANTSFGEAPLVAAARSTWKKSGASRVKIQYKTLEDVLIDGESQQYGGSGATAKISSIGKIIDMTGPEQRVYDDFTSFSRRSRRPIGADNERANFNIPELGHNLDTLLDGTEEEIYQVDRQIKYLKNQNVILAAEGERIHVDLKDNQEEISRMEAIAQIISKFYQAQKDVSLEDCKELFKTLKNEYAVEYTLYGLDAIAIPVLLPKIKSYFSNWNPLDPVQISHGYDMLSEWKELLGNIRGGPLLKHFDKEKNSTISAYDHCIWSGWMPNVQRAALVWNPRTNSPVMVSLVQLWASILPGWILEHFFEQVLVPKIKAEVDTWDPITDPVPIETWLQPWHPVMGDRLLLTYATLRQKLAKGLMNWMPGDRSAIECIRPWKNVFSSSTIHTFISMNIIPKLEKTMQHIDINNTDHFKYMDIFEWLDMMNPDVICQLLVKFFFPRYYQQICFQLHSPNMTLAELDKIKRGYMEWKNLMPSEVQMHEQVMNELKRVLVAISQVQSRLTGIPPIGAMRPSAIPSLASSSASHQPMPPGPFGLPPPPPQFTAQLPPASFKQLVESSAISNGIQFFPQRSKLQEGKQVYMFGDHSIYIDGTMLFCYNPTRRQWLPSSLNQMIEMGRKR